MSRGFWLERKAHEAFASDVVAHFLLAAYVGRAGNREKPIVRSGQVSGGACHRATSDIKTCSHALEIAGHGGTNKKTNLLSKETKTTSNSSFRSLAHLDSSGENALQGGHQPAET